MTAYLGLWPRLAVGIGVIGLFLRWFFQVAAGPSPSSSRKNRRRGGLGQVRVQTLLWGVLLTAHAAALARPRWVLAWNAQRPRLYVLEAAALMVGLLALGGALYAIVRHVGRRGSDPWSVLFGSVLFDSAFLGLVLVAVLSGLGTALWHRWASSWAAATIAPYVRSLLDGRSRPALVTQMPILVQVHVVGSFAAVALFPFTRPAAILIATLHRVVAIAIHPAAVMSGRLGHWMRWHSPAGVLWPEDDATTPLIAPVPVRLPPASSPAPGAADPAHDHDRDRAVGERRP